MIDYTESDINAAILLWDATAKQIAAHPGADGASPATAQNYAAVLAYCELMRLRELLDDLEKALKSAKVMGIRRRIA